jgi:hypothetical protein
MGIPMDTFVAGWVSACLFAALSAWLVQWWRNASERRRMAQVDREGRLQSIERGLARKSDDRLTSDSLHNHAGRIRALEAQFAMLAPWAFTGYVPPEVAPHA